MKRNALAVRLAVAATSLLAVNAADAALVAYWPLNDGPAGGNVSTAAEVINGNADNFLNGTIQTEAGGGVGTWFNDPVRGVVYSTTENDRLNAGTQGIDRTTGFTWSLWANVASSNIADANADVLIGTRAATGGVWNKIEVGAIAGDGAQNWATIPLATSISDDTWHHVTYLGDTTSVRLYIDGVLVGSDATTPTTTFNGALSFGGSSTFSEDATALMSDVAIWNEALTNDEVKSNFDIGNTLDLLYDAGQFDILKQLHDSGTGFTDIDDLRWSFASGLTGGAGLTGTAGNYTLVMNTTADTGLVGRPLQAAVPEPAAATLALLAAGGLMVRRRREA